MMTQDFAEVPPEGLSEGPSPSFGQLSLLDQPASGNPADDLVLGYRLSGVLDTSALRGAFTEVASRHEALLLFADMAAVQDVSAAVDPVSEARRLAEAELRISFDLQAGPLLRAQLFRLGADDHVLVITVHHIAADGWSIGVFESELSECYRAFAEGRPSPLAPLDIQQRSMLSDEVVEGLLGYWRERLRDLPEALELPVDRPRPSTPTCTAGMVSFDVPEDIAGRLRALAAELGATLQMVMLTAFDVLLAGYTGEQDLMVSVPDAALDRVEFDGMIGCLVNNLVLRVDCHGDPTISELLDRVRAAILGATEHRGLPFDRLVDELRPSDDPGRNPLAQVGFQLLSLRHPGGSLDLTGLAVEPFEVRRGTTRFDVEMHCVDRGPGGGPGGGLSGRIVYAADLFDESTMERFAGHFVQVLAGMSADVRLSRLRLLTDEQERQQLVEWNATEANLPEMTVSRMFEAQAARTPEAIAVSFRDEKLTYAELDARANRFAHRLRSHGVGPEVLVGLHVRRGLNAMVAILAVFKVGGAYLPIDPEYPADRVAYMLKDASCRLVIVEDGSGLDAAVLGEGASTIRIDHSADSAFPQTALPETALPETALPETPPGVSALDNLAYVIYTSGSTGRPKGVEVAQRSVANMAASHARSLGVGPRSRVLQVASLCGDVSVCEIWTTWISGGELVIPRAILIGDELARVLAEQRITQVLLASTLLATMPEIALPDLQTIMFGAEPCSPAVVNRWAPGRTLLNGYGPTETTVCVTAFRCEGDISAPAPIGKPISNTQMYILDKWLRPVPVGAAGDLYIGGVGVARGYLAKPELTASSFVANPFAADGSRLYRTGDLARFLPDGNIDFLGRHDSQIKLRGFRIELGEIESVIGEHPAVRQVGVVVRNERLYAYVVPADSDGADTKELMAEHLQDRQRRFDEEHREGRATQLPNRTAVGCIEAARPRRLLEIGCGAGALLRELLPACGRYVATDFSSVAINKLRSEFAGATGLTLLLRDAADFRGFRDASFDAVVIDSVLRHLPGLPTVEAVIGSAVSALSDSGTLVITDVRKHGDDELAIDPAYFSGLPDRIARVAEVTLVDREGCYDVVVIVGPVSANPGSAVSGQPSLAEPGAIDPALANDPLRGKRADRLCQEIRDLARGRLPSHMVPASVLLVDDLPLSPNGKVNLRLLPAPSERSEVRAPGGTKEEEALCAMFAEVLELEAISPDDGFFDRGGHSLLAYRLLMLIQSRLGVDLTLDAIFREPTPAGLAAYLNQTGE